MQSPAGRNNAESRATTTTPRRHPRSCNEIKSIYFAGFGFVFGVGFFVATVQYWESVHNDGNDDDGNHYPFPHKNNDDDDRSSSLVNLAIGAGLVSLFCFGLSYPRMCLAVAAYRKESPAAMLVTLMILYVLFAVLVLGVAFVDTDVIVTPVIAALMLFGATASWLGLLVFAHISRKNTTRRSTTTTRNDLHHDEESTVAETVDETVVVSTKTDAAVLVNVAEETTQPTTSTASVTAEQELSGDIESQ